MTEPWRNRIVGQREMAVAEIVDNPLNWRTHPVEQAAALGRALDRVGWVQQVVWNRTTGRLVDGHLRVALARERGEPEVPVLIVEIDPDEEAVVLATLDPITAMARSDAEKVEKLLAVIRAVDEATASQLAAITQATLSFGPEALVRPDFSGIVEQLGPAPADNPMTAAPNANWFYLEYYGVDATFQELRALIGEHMKSSHEIDPDWFADLVRSRAGEKPDASRT